MKRFTKILPYLLCGLLLCGCTEPNKSAESEMIYVKSVSLYDTIAEIYSDPESHVGESYHMVGTLYPSQDDDGETFYSIYAQPQGGGEGTGIELDWNDYSGFSDYDKVTVEGTLEIQQRMHHGEENDFLVMKVSLLEKRK